MVKEITMIIETITEAARKFFAYYNQLIKNNITGPVIQGHT